MMILHLVLLLTSSVYLTNAMCVCTRVRTFGDSVCYSDFAVVATVTEDPTTAKKSYNLDVLENYKTDAAPTKVYNIHYVECVKELESGKTYALAGSIEDGKAMIAACDYSFEIVDNRMPPTPLCAPVPAL